jgi:hypothetical protein
MSCPILCPPQRSGDDEPSEVAKHCRMQKFEDVLRRCEGGELSAIKAGEILGYSELSLLRSQVDYQAAATSPKYAMQALSAV